MTSSMHGRSSAHLRPPCRHGLHRRARRKSCLVLRAVLCLVLCLALCLPLLAVGCVDAELGDAPLLCNPGSPRCPKGYSCVRHKEIDYCIKEGVDPARLFSAPAPIGSSSDDAVHAIPDKGH